MIEPDSELDVDLFDFEPVPETGAGDEIDLDAIFLEFESLEREERLREEEAERAAAALAAEAAAKVAAALEPMDWEEELESSSAPDPEDQATSAALGAPPSASAAAPAPPKHAAAAAPAPGRAAIPAHQFVAAPPGTVLVAAPPADASGKRQLLTKSTLLILMTMTSVNALMAVVTLNRSSQMSDVGNRIVQVAEQIQVAAANVDPTPESNPRSSRSTGPLSNAAGDSLAQSKAAPLMPAYDEGHPTLDLALPEIGKGEFASARRRIYSLMAIIDRVDEDVRRDIESRAHFLLAEAAHLQALAAMELDG